MNGTRQNSSAWAPPVMNNGALSRTFRLDKNRLASPIGRVIRLWFSRIVDAKEVTAGEILQSFRQIERFKNSLRALNAMIASGMLTETSPDAVETSKWWHNICQNAWGRLSLGAIPNPASLIGCHPEVTSPVYADFVLHYLVDKGMLDPEDLEYRPPTVRNIDVGPPIPTPEPSQCSSDDLECDAFGMLSPGI